MKQINYQTATEYVQGLEGARLISLTKDDTNLGPLEIAHFKYQGKTYKAISNDVVSDVQEVQVKEDEEMEWMKTNLVSMEQAKEQRPTINWEKNIAGESK